MCVCECMLERVYMRERTCVIESVYKRESVYVRECERYVALKGRV